MRLCRSRHGAGRLGLAAAGAIDGAGDRSGGGSLDARTWKRRIDSVFGDRRHFIPYAEAGGWAQDIFDVLAALDDLVSAGHAAAVVALAEHAHRRSDKAVQYIDDSDGWLTDISGRIGELHLAACRRRVPIRSSWRNVSLSWS